MTRDADPTPRTPLDPHTLVQDANASQLVFAYEAVLSEMRTYAKAGDRTIAGWVSRLDSEREDFVRAASAAPRTPGLEDANRRAEYWKAEHLVANAEIDRLTAERDALHRVICEAVAALNVGERSRADDLLRRALVDYADRALNPEGAEHAD